MNTLERLPYEIRQYVAMPPWAWTPFGSALTPYLKTVAIKTAVVATLSAMTGMRFDHFYDIEVNATGILQDDGEVFEVVGKMKPELLEMMP